MNYLAYGSNLWEPRLRQRAPGARVMARLPLADWSLRFHKRSWADGSAKCNIVRQAGAIVHCVVYALARGDKEALDAAEGLGMGYRERWMEVPTEEGRLRVFTYLAEPTFIDEALRPFGWYRDLVVAGARRHRFPCDYVGSLRQTTVVADPDRQRAARERRWLAGSPRRL